MKFKFFISMLISFMAVVQVSSVQNFAGIFTMIHNSSTDNSLGTIGTANIYNRSPLSVWSNPAKLGYHKGYSLAYTRSSWFGEVIDDMYLNASYLSFGWNGIGIMIPSFNGAMKFGKTFEYGGQDHTDEDGNLIGTFKSYETASDFAIGVNCLEFTDYLNGYQRTFKTHELSFGLSFKHVYSDLSPAGTGQTEIETKGAGKAFTKNVGYIYRYSPLNEMNNKYYHTDFNVGLTLINPMPTRIHYGNESQSDPLPYGTRFGLSSKAMLKADFLDLFGIESSGAKELIDNLLALTFVYDIEQLGNFEIFGAYDKVEGYGVEISFLDFFHLRKGRYEDKVGHVIGNTHGFGFSWKYKDIFEFQYNHSAIPAGELQYKNRTDDYMVKVDFLKLFNDK